MSGEEIVNALRCCASVDGTGCAKCNNEELNNDELLPCADVLKSVAADLIENQQNHIRALMRANDALRRGEALEDRPNIKVLRTMNADRLLELAKADEEGRLFLLPLEPGRPMLYQEYFEWPWVMKDVTLCVQYQSSTGIIFYMGYDVFRGLVERGRITPLSPEGEETLEGKANV